MPNQPMFPDRPESMRCAGCDIENGCPEYCRCTPAAAQPAMPEPVAWRQLRNVIEQYANAKTDLALHPTHETAKAYFAIVSSNLRDQLQEAATALVAQQCARMVEALEKAEKDAARYRQVRLMVYAEAGDSRVRLRDITFGAGATALEMFDSAIDAVIADE